MAVPVRGVQIVFESILKSFANIHYPSIEANMLSRIQTNNITTYNKVNTLKQQILFEETEKYHRL